MASLKWDIDVRLSAFGTYKINYVIMTVFQIEREVRSKPHKAGHLT